MIMKTKIKKSIELLLWILFYLFIWRGIRSSIGEYITSIYLNPASNTLLRTIESSNGNAYFFYVGNSEAFSLFAISGGITFLLSGILILVSKNDNSEVFKLFIFQLILSSTSIFTLLISFYLSVNLYSVSTFISTYLETVGNITLGLYLGGFLNKLKPNLK